MKQMLLFLLVLLCMLIPAPDTARAGGADSSLFTLTDPVTGVSVLARNDGDEQFHFTADAEGRVLLADATGAYHYVEKENGGFRLGPPIENPAPTNPALVRAGDENLRTELTALRKTIVPLWEERLRNPRARSTRSVDYIENTYDFSASTSSDNPLYNSVFPRASTIEVPAKARTCALAVILVEFDEIKLKFSDEMWRRRIFDDGISSYYQTVSNGQFNYMPVHESDGVQNDGVIHVRLPLDKLTYAYPNSGNQNMWDDVYTGKYLTDQNEQYTVFNSSFLFAYAIKAAESSIDLGGYDRNGDGYISPTEVAFLVVCAGYEAAFCSNPYGEPAVWGHSWTVNTYRRAVPDPMVPDAPTIGEAMCVMINGFKVYKYTMMGENVNGGYVYQPESGRPVQAQFGTACHELGHDLGLADLYNTNYQQPTRLNVASLSVMADGLDGRIRGGEYGSSPTHFDPESKIRLGFYAPTVADTSGVYTLYATEPCDLYNILRINTDDPDVYYLVENRQFTGYDKGLEDGYPYLPEGGVVIWRINEKRVRGHYASNTLNTDEGDYGIMPVFLDETANNPYGGKIPFWSGSYRALGKTSFAIPERPGAVLYLQDAGGPRTTVRLVLPSVEAAPPQTGDSAAPLQWALTAICSAALLALALRRRRA